MVEGTGFLAVENIQQIMSDTPAVKRTYSGDR